MQHIGVLGSTGSVGTQALEVIAANKQHFSVSVLAAYQNDTLLEKQIEEFQPAIAVLVDDKAADRLIKRYKGQTKILVGEDGLVEAATYQHSDTVLNSLVGFSGLKPTVAAIQAGKKIALANKETLVAAGELVMSLAEKYNVSIVPVDSEHSAIFQCLKGENKAKVERIILTASGGPFLGRNRDRLSTVSIEECLRHPNWSMGKKITIDSATLANKGLEVIEAKWLFGVEYSQIDVVVHPQSIIHSAVEFCDGSTLAQMGKPDMRLPIQYAFSYPDRIQSDFPRLDFKSLSALTFLPPDEQTFSALSLAFLAGKTGGTMPCVFNAANEVAVYGFLAGEIPFLAISEVIKNVMAEHAVSSSPTLDDIFTSDLWARKQAISVMQSRS